MWMCPDVFSHSCRALSNGKGDRGSYCHTEPCHSKRLNLPQLINAVCYFYWIIHHLKHTESRAFTESFVQSVAKSIRTCGLARWKSLNSILFRIKVIFHLSLTQFRLPKNGCIPCGWLVFYSMRITERKVLWSNHQSLFYSWSDCLIQISILWIVWLVSFRAYLIY